MDLLKEKAIPHFGQWKKFSLPPTLKDKGKIK